MVDTAIAGSVDRCIALGNQLVKQVLELHSTPAEISIQLDSTWVLIEMVPFRPDWIASGLLAWILIDGLAISHEIQNAFK